MIDASPLGELMFLVTDHGSPFAEVGFGNWFREKCDKADLTQCAAILRCATAEAGDVPSSAVTRNG
jgi:hypothetical protein